MKKQVFLRVRRQTGVCIFATGKSICSLRKSTDSMVFIQMTGLSGAGKSTIATNVKKSLQSSGYQVEVIDGDEYRQHLCRDLGFSKADRHENIRRLAFVGLKLCSFNVIVILAAINPYEEIRAEIKSQSSLVKTVWVNCDLETLIHRDTKGLYSRALLPDGHTDKLVNLTGVNDPFDTPKDFDLKIDTHNETTLESESRLLNFILQHIKLRDKQMHQQ